MEGDSYLISPSLVKIKEEDDIVAQRRETMQERHFDGEGEEVVDEGVEELVHHCSRGHVRDGFEAVVDVEAGHLEENKCRVSMVRYLKSLCLSNVPSSKTHKHIHSPLAS